MRLIDAEKIPNYALSFTVDKEETGTDTIKTRIAFWEDIQKMPTEIVGKETAKKPIYDESYDGLCPNCKNMAFRDVWWYENDKPVNYSHCHFCGQKIDWTEDEEVNDNGRD